jgi:hypothetical protein
MNRFMSEPRHHDAINIGGGLGFHTAWVGCGSTTNRLE